MYQRYRPLLPILVLLAFCISTIIFKIIGTTTDDGTPSDYVLGAKHYGAFLATGVTLASFFLLRSYFKYLFLLTFLLGLFGLINFTIAERSLGLTLGDVRIGLSTVVVVVGIITYLLNRQRINTSLFALIKPSDEKVAQIRQDEIADFKDRFSRKSTEELAQIVAAKALVPSALAAAQQLIQERQ
jgi:hypothetical protein